MMKSKSPAGNLDLKTSKNPPDGVSFTLKELCFIIRTCRKNNVLEFKYNGLEVNLSGKTESVTSGPFHVTQPMSDESIKRDRDEEAQSNHYEELEYLKINNPLEYERMIAEEMNAGL